jgi:hypothetical protein
VNLRNRTAHLEIGMRESDFRMLIVVMVFLALFIVWVWPEGGPVRAVFGSDPMLSQSSK